MKAIALKELYDEDWKTQRAQGYKNIPNGAEVEIIGPMSNFYGNFMRVRYNNIVYYVNGNNLKIIV